MRRRVLIIGVVSLVILIAVVYLGVGAYVYNVISAVKPGCQTHIEDMKNSPSAFSAPDDDAHAQADMTGFQMGAYEEVKFPSRDDKLTIDGWYVPAQGGYHQE